MFRTLATAWVRHAATFSGASKPLLRNIFNLRKQIRAARKQTAHERQSLYDQRSCHSAYCLYQRCSGSQELFWSLRRSDSTLQAKLRRTGFPPFIDRPIPARSGKYCRPFQAKCVLLNTSALLYGPNFDPDSSPAPNRRAVSDVATRESRRASIRTIILFILVLFIWLWDRSHIGAGRGKPWTNHWYSDCRCYS
jgi:hypothetical protein